MYYKDDFYKEFRTEKELCEYLEEIDSRAEWIRVTSKKLKVAAAGEETCTEVPGISLEALEKDTLSHSRLVLILPERICYIGNSAIKSLKGRARIDGKALADVDKKTLAEILNKCLKVARGRALIRFCEGKIRAVLSGDEKDYAIISMPDMYMVTSAYIHGDYEKATFLNGYADHYSVTASWQLEDTKLTDVYKELMQNYGRKTDKDIKAAVRKILLLHNPAISAMRSVFLPPCSLLTNPEVFYPSHTSVIQIYGREYLEYTIFARFKNAEPFSAFANHSTKNRVRFCCSVRWVSRA